MRISPISRRSHAIRQLYTVSPRQLQQEVLPLLHISAARQAQKTTKKSRKRKTLDLKKSVDHLTDVLDESDTEAIEAHVKPQTNKPKAETSQENSISPEYDPESSMAEMRFSQAHAHYKKSKLEEKKNIHPIHKSRKVTSMSLEQDKNAKKFRVSDDRFSYFTLIEALILYHILYEKCPMSNVGIKYGTFKLLKKKKELHSVLIFHQKKTVLKKFHIIFHIPTLQYKIIDLIKGQPMGELRYTISETMMEEAKGRFDDVTICLDPVWDPSEMFKIRYQDIRIGDYRLDLTAVTRDHRKGRWKGPIQKKSIPFDVIYDSARYHRHHIRTKKQLKVGEIRVSLSLKFFDDAFSEPYSATGKLVTRK